MALVAYYRVLETTARHSKFQKFDISFEVH